MKNRIVALILSVMMLTSIIPSPVLAQQTEEILPEEDVNAQIEETVPETETIPEEETPQEIISVETTTNTLLAASTVATGVCGSNLSWKLDSKGTLTIRGSGGMLSWASPLESDNNAPWYEYRSSIKNVVIENGVVNIGSYAFYECTNVTSVMIPECVKTIGSYAFAYCKSLTSIEIPVSVTKIDNCAFLMCDSLTRVVNAQGVKTLGAEVFYRCKSLEFIVIPQGVTSIGASEFYYCTNLKSVVIPKGVTWIGQGAFNYCSNLKDVYFGGTASEWRDNVTVNSGNTNLTSAQRRYNIWSSGQIWSYNEFDVLYIKGHSRIPDWTRARDVPWYNEVKSFNSIWIDKGVTYIGDYAFSGCDNVEDVYFGGSKADFEKIEVGLSNGVLSADETLIHYNATIAGHSKTEKVVAEADCENPKQYRMVCSDCGAQTDVYTKNNILGHKKVTNAATAPSCTEDGLTQGSYCASCGDVFIKQEVIPATGHSWDAGKINSSGEFVYTCGNCGEELVSAANEIDVAVGKIIADGFDVSDKDEIKELKKQYDELTQTEKTFVSNGEELILMAEKIAFYEKGDIDLSGTINSTDLSELLGAYGTKNDACDINGDGLVNSTDLSTLLSGYGTKR